MFRLRRPGDDSLRQLLAGSEDALPTYPEVGATKGDALPSGYRHDRYEIGLGGGAGVFERAGAALLEWRAQIDAGLEVFPRGARVEDGSTIVLLVRAGLWVPAPCRVVYVVETPETVGFAYGTLPGHPECGEAAFTILRGGDGNVSFVVRSFSRRVDPLARLGAPVARALQTRVNESYLEAIARASRGS